MVEIISDFSACDFYDYNLDSKIYTHQLQCSHHSGQMRPFHSMRSMDTRTDQGSFGILTRSPHWTGIGTVVRINVYSIINAMFSRQINQPGRHFVIIRSKMSFAQILTCCSVQFRSSPIHPISTTRSSSRSSGRVAPP